MTWNWGQKAYVRADSMRKMTLADLVVSRALGPEKSGPLSRIMCLVLRKGDVHKDRFTLDRVVGCWRSKDYLSCPVFAISAHLLVQLNSRRGVIDFRWENRRQPARWHKHKLISWEPGQRGATQAYNATKKVLDSCGVSLNKVTHLRTVGKYYGLRIHSFFTSTSSLF